ncbi:reverse transcriptase domain-containing protein [Lactovum miscens]|uniref:reverse transcriptase domain-containing protein n=1 Tax=Lactovum miscens TaxID=190387 RepID=UPI002EDBB1FE
MSAPPAFPSLNAVSPADSSPLASSSSAAPSSTSVSSANASPEISESSYDEDAFNMDILHEGRNLPDIPDSLMPLWILVCKKLLQLYTSTDFQQRPLSKTACLFNILTLPKMVLYSKEHLRGKEYWASVETKLRSLLSGNCAIEESRLLIDLEVESFEEEKERENLDSEEYKQSSLIRKVVQLAKKGDLSRASRLLNSFSSLAPINNMTIQKLKELHPPADFGSDVIPQTPADSPIVIIDDAKANSLYSIMQFSNGSSPGPSGWGGNMVSSLLLNDECKALFVLFIEDIINARISSYGKRWLTSSKLIAIDKPNGGLRPIAIGELFTRISGRFLTKLVEKKTNDFFSPVQFGIGVQNGSEKVVHSVRQELLNSQKENVLLSIDVRNAFNTVNRKEVLQELFNNNDFAPLWKFAGFSYSDPAQLLLQTGHFIKSKTGVRQGDPLSSFLFGLTIQKHLKKITETGLHCYAYLDDINICGDKDQVIKALPLLTAAFKTINLNINVNKSSLTCFRRKFSDIYNPSSLQNLEQIGISLHEKEIKVLGIDIKNPQHSDISFELHGEKKQQLSRFFNRIQNTNIPTQIAMQLLRISATPKLNYSSRCTPPSEFLSQARFFDQLVLSSAHKVLKLQSSDINNQINIQLRCPVRLGGFGLCSAEENSEISYIASLSSCASTQAFSDFTTTLPPSEIIYENITSCLNKITGLKTYKGTKVLPDNAKDFFTFYVGQKFFTLQHFLQSEKYRINYKESEKKLLESKDVEQIARFRSITAPHANLWKTVNCDNKQKLLQDFDFITATRLNLGLPSSIKTAKCPSCSKALEENDSWHLLSCNHHKRRSILQRHDHIVRSIDIITKRLGWISRIEPKQLDSNSRKKPDLDVTINGTRFFIDVRITHPLAASNVQAAAKRTLGAAIKGEELKTKKYIEISVANNAKFVPLVMETLGAIAPLGREFIKELWRASFSVVNGTKLMKDFLETIAIQVQRGNKMVLSAGFDRYIQNSMSV